MSTDQNLAGNKPVQRWLIRDYQIRGAATSATSQGGVRLGLTTPATSNRGGMAPVILGDPDDTTDLSTSLALVNGGSLGSAQWVWADSAGTWYGAHSDLYRWGFHNPTPTLNQGACVCYSSVFRRVVVASIDNTSTARVRVSYAALNDRPQSSGDWTSSTFVPTNGEYGGSHSLAICELRDGALLLAVRRTDGDFDFYRSIDGGDNWVLSTVGFLAALGVNPLITIETSITPKLAAAGDWVRFVVGYLSGLLTYTSSDSGASWVETGTLVNGVDLDGTLSSVQANDVQPFGLAAVDASTGAFVLVVNPPASGDTNKIRMLYASRGNNWVAQSVFGNPTIDTTPRAYLVWQDPTWLYVWAYAGDPGDADDGWYTFRAPRGQILESSAWQAINPSLGPAQTHDKTLGATRLTPIQMTACWCGDRAAVCGYLQDQEESSPVTRKAPRPWLSWVGGWSARPWGNRPLLVNGYAEAVHWSAEQGDPAGEATSSSDTGWTTTISGAGTHSWNAQVYVETSTNSGSSTQRAYLESLVSGATAGAAPSWSNTDAQAWAAEWSAAVGLTAIAALGGAGVSAGLRFEVPDDTLGGGFGWRIQVALGTNQAILGGGSSGTSPLATLTGLDLRTAESLIFHRFRFAVAPAASPSAPVGILQYRRDDGDAWQETATFSLGLSASLGVTQHSTRFGLLSLGSSGADTYLSRWREVRISSGRFLVDYTNFNVTKLPGAFSASLPRTLSAGSTATDPSRLAVAWGGAGGAFADAWSHSVGYDFPASALGMDSPQIPWRSSVGATAGQRIVFDACGAGATVDNGSRWTHSGLALFGVEHLRTVVTYSDDASGLVNAVSSTLSTLQYSGIRVVAQAGRVLRISQPTGSWRDGDLSGRLFLVTAAGASAAVGQVHKIERHLIGDDGVHRIEFATGSQFSGSAIGAGDSLSIFADRGWLSYGSTLTPRRYLTLTFGAAGDNNWGGYWTCGSVVPGLERTWSPPLLWTHTDESNPFLTVQRARGGQSWAYRDAPPERTWTGRQMGATNGERQFFRDAVTYLSRSGEEPCALLLDAELTADQDRTILLTRYIGAVSLDNQAYARAAGSTSQARAVGDLAIQFVETN